MDDRIEAPEECERARGGRDSRVTAGQDGREVLGVEVGRHPDTMHDIRCS